MLKLFRFYAAGTNEHLDFSLSWQANEDLLKDHAAYDWDPGIHNKPMLLPIGKAQLAGFLKVWVGVNWNGMQASSDNVYEESLNVATPEWCAVLSC